MWWLVKEPFGIAIYCSGNCSAMSFSNCLVFSEVPKPGELVKVTGYVFIEVTTYPLQLFLDQGPHAFDGIGVCTTVGVNKVLGIIG